VQQGCRRAGKEEKRRRAKAVSAGASAPSLPPEILISAIAVLVPSIIVNLVLLARRPVAPRTADGSPQRMPATK
jgi:hypothetical protein